MHAPVPVPARPLGWLCPTPAGLRVRLGAERFPCLSPVASPTAGTMRRDVTSVSREGWLRVPRLRVGFPGGAAVLIHRISAGISTRRGRWELPPCSKPSWEAQPSPARRQIPARGKASPRCVPAGAGPGWAQEDGMGQDGMGSGPSLQQLDHGKLLWWGSALEGGAWGGSKQPPSTNPTILVPQFPHIATVHGIIYPCPFPCP